MHRGADPSPPVDLVCRLTGFQATGLMEATQQWLVRRASANPGLSQDPWPEPNCLLKWPRSDGKAGYQLYMMPSALKVCQSKSNPVKCDKGILEEVNIRSDVYLCMSECAFSQISVPVCVHNLLFLPAEPVCYTDPFTHYVHIAQTVPIYSCAVWHTVHSCLFSSLPLYSLIYPFTSVTSND